MSAKSGGECWLDGYNGERTIVLDEFRGQIPLDFVKNICDQYHFQIAVKGGFVPFSPDNVVFTSQHHPDDWWPGDPHATPEDRAAFAARCVVYQFSRIAGAAQDRSNKSFEALGGQEFLDSLPGNAREAPSRWLDQRELEGQAARGRSANLRVPDVQFPWGISPQDVPVQPGSLEARLDLLNPSHSMFFHPLTPLTDNSLPFP